MPQRADGCSNLQIAALKAQSGSDAWLPVWSVLSKQLSACFLHVLIELGLKTTTVLYVLYSNV